MTGVFRDPEMASEKYINKSLYVGDELDEDLDNLSDVEIVDDDLEDSEDNFDGLADDRSNYIIKSDGEREYLLRLDEMNESELQSLLEELKYNPTKSHYYTSMETDQYCK